MSVQALTDGLTTMLLDMNGTFMFGHDHLDDSADFYATYRRLGGRRLGAIDLDRKVRSTICDLDDLYRKEDWNTRFPSVRAVVERAHPALPAEEKRLIEQVIAEHERGTVSEADQRALTELSRRYRLVVVSNLWSDSAPWTTYLSGLGAKLFSGFVFSSDIGVNKPAPEIFLHALKIARSEPSETAMVGDDLARDIVPASALGMRTVWITGAAAGEGLCDVAVRRLTDLAVSRDDGRSA